MFSRIVESGGGVGWYSWTGSAVTVEIAVLGLERKQEDSGIGREMTDPRKEMLAIHFDERRGSRVSAAADQYLHSSPHNKFSPSSNFE